MCQQLVEVGLLYHISKELQFEDGDAVYKFDFSDNPKKVRTTKYFLKFCIIIDFVRVHPRHLHAALLRS